MRKRQKNKRMSPGVTTWIAGWVYSVISRAMSWGMFPARRAVVLIPAIAVAAAMMFVFSAIKQHQFETVLPIRVVKVEGQLDHLDRRVLQQTVLATLEGGYFTLNLSRVRTRLMKDPWVKEVFIRRRWPAQLLVSVIEKQPVAYWNQQAFISAEGNVFQPEIIDQTLLLPRMYGPQGQHKKVWMFMNEIYPPLAAMAMQVKALYLDERRAWKLALADAASEKNTQADNSRNKALIVRLGRYQTRQRFKRFVQVFSSANSPDLAQLQSVDMRYPNGFAVLRKNTVNNNNKFTILDQLNIFNGNIYEKIIAMKNIRIIKHVLNPSPVFTQSVSVEEV